MATNPTAWFVITVAVFFVLRPYWNKSATEASVGVDPSVAVSSSDNTRLRAEFQELKDQRNAIVDDYQRMSGLEARFEDKFGNLKNEIAANSEALVKLDEQLRDRRDRNANSFYALWVKDETARLEAVIRRDAADLYDRLHSGETYSTQAWSSWERVHAHWNEAVGEWMNLARFYAPGDLNGRLFTVEEVEFGGPWSVQDQQFPTGDAVRRFKRHRIIQRHWEEVLEAVKRNVHMVAFEGLSIEDARRGALTR